MRKVALITGGSRGIGLGIAEKLARSNFDVVISGRRPAAEVADVVEQLRACGARVLYVASDIADSADRDNLIAEVRSKFGRLDVLVNNAGVAPQVRCDLLEMSEESFRRVMQTNLHGPFFLTQSVALWMLEQRAVDSDFKGTIITISSVSAEIASVNRGEYCISKAGLSMLTKLFAARLGGDEISVFEIRPGIIKSDMTNAVSDKYNKLIVESDLCVIKRWGLPEDIGEVALAMAEGKLPYCVGQVITVDGGVSLQRL